MINQLSQCNYSNNAITKICKAIIIIEIMITMNNNKIIQYVFQKKRSILFQERSFLSKHSLD